MLRRLHAPGCLLAALSLLAPRVAKGEPVEDDVTAAPADAATDAGDAPPPSSDDAPPASSETQGTADRAPLPDPASDDEGLDDEGSDDEGSDDEGSDDEGSPRSPLPDQLPRLQRIGWYHVLGAFTLGTTAGVLAGLAERQEDKATRIASGYDLETGGTVLYADRQDAYETSLDRGQAFATSAIVIGALAGATAIAAITLFAVDAKRRGPSTTARRTRIGAGSLEVAF